MGVRWSRSKTAARALRPIAKVTFTPAIVARPTEGAERWALLGNVSPENAGDEPRRRRKADKPGPAGEGDQPAGDDDDDDEDEAKDDPNAASDSAKPFPSNGE